MTCIVGVRQNGKVWLGGDSAGIAGWELRAVDLKVFQRGPFLYGVAGSVRVSNLIRYAFQPPAPLMSLSIYMVTTWIDALRDCLKAGGVAGKNNEVEELTDSALLVGIQGRLFSVYSDYQVSEDQAAYAGVGCGAATALGALAVSWQLPPAARCRAALRAAELHNIGVRGPFVVQSLRNS